MKEISFLTKKGFTLIEILLVVVIIGLISAMVIPNIAGRGESARVAVAKADIDANLSSALDMYELDAGRYPTSEQGLNALIAMPSLAPLPSNWRGPYLKKKSIPQDPWGNTYVYVYPGEQNMHAYDLSSLGADGEKSDDDIGNWE